MKKIFTALLALCAVASSWAQSGKVTATILDAETKHGVVGAIVELVSTTDDARRKHSTSGYGGKTEISGVAYGTYRATVSFIGYQNYTAEVKVGKGTTDMGQIMLAVEATRIDAVVKEVQALRTSQNGDTVSYNAAAFKVSADADVEGLLKKMPGITITNGTVEAQGEEVKKIFVDGKEFFGEDVSTAINSLPAQSVDKIEVFNKLSDNAEFSGMDDGEGYKAINIITHSDMRKGQFGKVYAGYGYQPSTDEVASHHKYIAGGNINIFNNSSRLSVIGLLNNVNQQNFSFEDILGVSGATGGRGGGMGRGVGQYMVRPQSGVANVGSLGVNYSDAWGEKDKVKLTGSYFFNRTNTKNINRIEKWYEEPSPIDTLEQEGYSRTLNNNHRLNLRLDWRISENQSLMSRTGFSYQSNDPTSSTEGVQWGESGYNIIRSGSIAESAAMNLREFLSYRAKLGKAGRTITVDGFVNWRNTSRSHTDSYSTLDTAIDPSTGDYYPVLRYVSQSAPTSSLRLEGSFTYTEPISKSSQLSLQYRASMSDQNIEKTAYITGDDYSTEGLLPDASLSRTTDSRYITHRVGPGFRYAKNRNTVVANVYYQYSTLDGGVRGFDIKRNYNDFTYFLMGNIAINKENTIRLFVMSSTENPSVGNLQDIYDVSNAQYISKGNPDLNPAYTHRINFHYVRSNVEKGRTFMWMFSSQFTQDYIGSSIYYNKDIEVDNGDGTTTQYRPLQYVTYANLDGYRSLRTHLSYGFPINPIKCNLNLMAGLSYTRTPSLIDDQINNASNMGYDAMVSLGSNISENLDFTLQWSGTYNETRNSLAASSGKNRYFSHTASGNLKWVFWKGLTLTLAATYNQFVGFTNDYNESYLLCNAYLGKKIFKNQRGEVMIGVNDLLDQNTAFSRTSGSGFTQNAWNSVIGRYFTVQFTYNLRHFNKNASKDISDYNGMDIKAPRPFGGRPPMGPHR